MEAKKKPAKNDNAERNINDFAVGDGVKVNMHRGRIVDGTVKAVVNHTDGPRLQVDFGNDETALILCGKSSKPTTQIPLHGSPDRRISELSVKTLCRIGSGALSSAGKLPTFFP